MMQMWAQKVVWSDRRGAGGEVRGSSCLDEWAEHWRHTGKVGDEGMHHAAAAARQAAVRADDLVGGQASERHIGCVAYDEPLHD